MTQISIVLPVYNEKPSILETFIHSLIEILKSYSFEIILVDDGSDPEFKKNYDHFKNIPQIQILTHNKNKGQIEALKSGLLQTNGDLIFSMDADGEYPAANLIQMINELNSGKDLVNGVRTYRTGYSIIKKTGSFLVNSLFRVLNPEYHLRDLLCPVCGIQRNFWNKFSSSPFLFRHLKLHFLIFTPIVSEIPVTYSYICSKKSNYSIWGGVQLFFSMVMEIFYFSATKKQYVNPYYKR